MSSTNTNKYGFDSEATANDPQLDEAPIGVWLVQILGFAVRDVRKPGPRKGQKFYKIKYRTVAGRPNSEEVAKTYKLGTVHEQCIFLDQTSDVPGTKSNTDLKLFFGAAVASSENLEAPYQQNQICMKKSERKDGIVFSIEEKLDEGFPQKAMYIELVRRDKEGAKPFPQHIWQPLSAENRATLIAKQKERAAAAAAKTPGTGPIASTTQATTTTTSEGGK
jgi:hypothetical protein